MAVQKGKGGITSRSIRDGAIFPGKVLEDVYAGKYFKAVFPGHQPSCFPIATPGYGTPAGTTGATNLAQFSGGFGDLLASYFILGAGQTLLAPYNDSTLGVLLAGLDAAASEGVEWVPGGMNTVNNPFAVVCGDGDYPAMFIRLKFQLATVANAAECAVGFRKAEANQALIDNYDEMFCLNAQAGVINVESILNGAGTGTFDTGKTAVDATPVTLEVQVRSRRAEGFVNGLPVSAGPLFNFDLNEVVIPFIHFLQGGAATTFGWIELEVGQLQHVGRDPSRR